MKIERLRRRAFVLVALLVLAGACAGCGASSADSTPTPSAAASRAPTSSTLEPSPSMLPALGMPGARAGPAGEYGWTGALGSFTGMHRVVAQSQTQMVFAVENDCFASDEGPEPVLTTVAGFDSLYVEPYDGPHVLFMLERVAGETTGGYQIAIADRTLCVYLTWDAATTSAELEAARAVIASIRAQPFGTDGIRIVLTLPQGWDTG